MSNDNPVSAIAPTAVSPDEVIASQRNRQVLALTAVIVVLAGLVGISRLTRSGETRIDPVPLVASAGEASFTREKVDQVEIWRGQGSPLVLKRAEGGWRVPETYNAPADSIDVDNLLNKVFESKRLGRPSTEDASRYAIYSLSDDDATHLILRDRNGAVLLHLLCGRGEDGSRDFIRIVGQDAPAGIFELANPGGSWDSLYSRLNLDAQGRPDVKRWLDLSGFKVVPGGAKVDALTIEDGDLTFEFRRNKEDDKKWEVLRPGRLEGDSTSIQGLVTTLEGLAATDIAGRDTDGATLGIAESRRRVMLEYTADGQPGRSTLVFGNQKDSSVTVHLTSVDQGSLIHRVGEHVLQRIFRKLTEFARPADVGLVPLGREAVRVRVADGDKQVEAELREQADGKKEWFLSTPVEGKADRMRISTLTNRLNTLRGAKALETPDLVALGVDPAHARRWLELSWTEPGEAREGEPPAADVTRTGALYFGKVQGEQAPVLKRVSGLPDEFFWLEASATDDLFVDPDDYHFFEHKVRQILLSWKGKNPRVQPRDPERTEQQARELAASLLERARSGEDFKALQVAFNEDSGGERVYDVTPSSGFVEPFTKLAARLAVGGADMCESDFGLHILMRVE